MTVFSLRLFRENRGYEGYGARNASTRLKAQTEHNNNHRGVDLDKMTTIEEWVGNINNKNVTGENFNKRSSNSGFDR